MSYHSFITNGTAKTKKTCDKTIIANQLSFPIFPNFLPNPGRILPALTYNGSQPLNVNAGRILPGFGGKLGNIGKLY